MPRGDGRGGLASGAGKTGRGRGPGGNLGPDEGGEVGRGSTRRSLETGAASPGTEGTAPPNGRPPQKQRNSEGGIGSCIHPRGWGEPNENAPIKGSVRLGGEVRLRLRRRPVAPVRKAVRIEEKGLQQDDRGDPVNERWRVTMRTIRSRSPPRWVRHVVHVRVEGAFGSGENGPICTKPRPDQTGARL